MSCGRLVVRRLRCGPARGGRTQAACAPRCDALAAQATDLRGGAQTRGLARIGMVGRAAARTVRPRAVCKCGFDGSAPRCPRRARRLVHGRPSGGNAVSQLPRRALMALVRAYRLLLSPWLGSSCRFEPTCSAYALQALERHGALAGSALTLGRIARCHPWCAGGHDPVPPHPPRIFTALLSKPGRRSSSSDTSSDSATP